MTDPRFPELTQRQIEYLKPYGIIEHFEKETVVFAIGDLQYDFYVILDGEICVKNRYNNDAIVVTHKKNEFTGDSSMLSNRSAQFNGYAAAGTTVLRIKPNKLKEAIAKYSDISDILLSAFIQRQETMLNDFVGGMKLIGSGLSKDTYQLRDFMEKNHIWYNFLDTETSEEALELLETFNLSEADLPLFISSEGDICKEPTLDRLAEYTGVLMDFGDEVFDLLVIGAGPAGLAASVYAASEGLSVVTIDSNAPGGQAGKSSKIENYLGFPTGISGTDLANKAYVQAQKFGCNISIPHKAERVEHNGDYYTLYASNNKVIKSRAIIAATGANYRQLPIANIEQYEGSGVYYSATGMNASSCKNELVGVVGGGNSAGQAALFLADHAKEVHVIIRGNDLGAKMSDYLVQRIEASDNTFVHKQAQVTELNGEHHLKSVVLTSADGTKTPMNITNLFTFIGAKPCTEWLKGLIDTDERGFIHTGAMVNPENLLQCPIYRREKPQSLETNIPGFFAVGDVRKGSVKRVASAVGEGSMAVSQVHQYLANLKTSAVES
ncbi:cyclic nucleotide-binding domain-containing thioredoxin-disulfide reductase [Winogradskyella sp.]|uniref:FAD-dependent oxidoreductase n=1 Tax=Winogradskyella sp. TaxID=1883156 RepID=UPI0026382480|nr:cyclic nucleotide-binding domain-containing thioredoxin-disulfide reductase [Winogradskyella sp.]